METVQDKYLTVGEVADRLRVSVRWVYDRLWAGELPRARFGAAWRIPRAEFESWVESQTAREARRVQTRR